MDVICRKLQLLEVISVDKDKKTYHNKQPFDYLLVLDFEATCWNNPRARHQSEIIEFPVVLYDVKNDNIVAEFQRYVTPTQHPKLSDFCTQLTGIQQHQVDNGVPLCLCLLSFMTWLEDNMTFYNMDFPNQTSDAKNTCVFATWSDWDLGVCLKNECARKLLYHRKIFCQWIDVRALFRLRFRRPFTGLAGAMSNVGLEFEGNQHCGLHDARNTARLVGKMIKNGVTLQLTTL